MKSWKDDARSVGLNSGYQIKTLGPDRYVAMGVSVTSNMEGERLARLNRGWAAGSGMPLVGSAEQVTDEPKKFAEIRLGEIICNPIEPESLTRNVRRDLLLLLGANGERKPRRVSDALLRAVR